MRKVGKRKQQGRTDGNRTGEHPKVECPLCKDAYLQSSYGKERGKMKTIGEYCPNPECPYITKIKSDV